MTKFAVGCVLQGDGEAGGLCMQRRREAFNYYDYDGVVLAITSDTYPLALP